MCGVQGCPKVEPFCSQECCPGDAGIDVELLLRMWRPLESSYLVVNVGEDVARDLV